MAFKPEGSDFLVESGDGPLGKFSKLLITVYHRATLDALQDEIVDAVKYYIGKFVAGDEEFRSNVEAITREVCANLPLDEIRKAVKEAIAANRLPGKV